MSNLKQIALSTIPRPESREYVLFPHGDTKDIVSTILYADKLAAPYTKVFAPSLLDNTIYRTAKKIFDFAFYNITYKLDPLGEQYIKSPSQTIHDGFGDCKSFSVFTASILKNLGIPYSYRFASYSPAKVWTHVYVVAHDKGRDIIIDPVWKKFDSEKKPIHKIDYLMTKVSYVAGVGSSYRRLLKKAKTFRLGSPESRLSFNKDIDSVSEAEMDLKIAQQRLAIERDIVAGIAGIGSLKVEHYNDALDVVNDMVGVVEDNSLSDDEKIAEIGQIEEDAENGLYSIAGQIAGIGDIGKKAAARKQKKAARQVARKEKKAVKKVKKTAKKKVRATKRKAFVKKVATKIKKGVKAVAKVATAPQRLLVKGILEAVLPKTAPLFLYTFLPDNAAAQAPAKVQKKRNKALKLKKFIVNTIGMKESHFNGIVRNGTTKRYGRSPEAVLAKFTEGKTAVAGIGVLPLAALIPTLLGMITKLMGAFKKNKSEQPDFAAGDEPDESDFESAAPEEKTSVKRTLRSNNPSPTTIDAREGNGGNRLSAGGRGATTGLCGGGKKKAAAPVEESTEEESGEE